MIIYDFLTCSKCNESYSGAFIVHTNGEITCVDCKNKIYSSYKVNKNNKKELEKKMVVNYLGEDIARLYPLVLNLSELKMDMFLLDSELDLYKTYYQGNDLDFCKKCRDVAYKSLMYIESNDSEHIDLAYSLIHKYLDLRFHKLTNLELKEYMELLNSNDVNTIIMWEEY